MSSGPEFQVEIYQNEYLPDGAREVNAVLRDALEGVWLRGGPLGLRADIRARDGREVLIAPDVAEARRAYGPPAWLVRTESHRFV